ncbi:TRAM domain-containing protein [Halobaculum marinum]|uniref:TRAM domain-containing protein n=1 Tax=Halobaculum marinum TaxID=3031996 RepID=A0ABD5X2U5_9EURY|nr:TRAM domain-containing protein [Halobaculum sp. DT55]
MEISEDLRCVFSADVEERDGSYVVEVPKREVDLGTLREGAVYRVALLERESTPASSAPTENVASGSTRSESSDAPTSTSDDSTDAAPSGDDEAPSIGSNGSNATTDGPEPPVDRGDEVTVDIEGIGDQGDGIARVDRGYVIIVPDTEKGERVTIRVTSVKQNVAFAEVLERVERQQYE